MTSFDQAQSPRLGQRTAVENPGVRILTQQSMPEVAYRGQIIYLNDLDEFRVYDGVAWQIPTAASTGGNQTFVQSETTSGQPVADAVGDSWLNTDTYQLYTWDGTVWQKVVDPNATDAQNKASAAQAQALESYNVATDQITTFYMATQPTTADNPQKNDIWVNTTSNTVYNYLDDGTGNLVWTQMTGPAAQAYADAGTAQATADQKITAYYQAAPGPTGVDLDDLWFDTGDGNHPYRWDGSTWVDLQDQLAVTANTTANTSVQTYTSEYAVSSSDTVAPTTGWSSATPTRTPGEYIWYRVTVTHGDGSSATTNPALMTGNDGAQGPTGPQGPQGSQGIPGPAGADGTTYYTWLKYADSPTSGMSDSPTGKTYMGLAYNKTSSTESTNYADYSWSLIQGPQGSQGVPGPAGTDGQSLYTWVKYASDANGTGLTDSPTGMSYIGLAYNKTSQTESTVATDYTWSLIQGPQGTAGATGATGVSTTAITPYYQLVNSGSAAPATPTTDPPPSPWTTTEPSYQSGMVLYRTDKISFSDATFAYTVVTLSSSYAAATQAITTADGKNTVYYFNTTPPSGGTYSAGDLAFDADHGFQPYYWDNTLATPAWVAYQYGTDAIENLTVSKLIGGELTEQMAVVSGSLIVGGNSQIQLDSTNGLRVFDNNGNKQATFPVDGSGITLTADVTANTLTVVDKMTLQAPENDIAPGTAFVMNSTQSAPTSPPTVFSSWTQGTATVNNNHGGATELYGLQYLDPEPSTTLAGMITCVANSDKDPVIAMCDNNNIWHKLLDGFSDPSQPTSADSQVIPTSIQMMGGHYYVLCRVWDNVQVQGGWGGFGGMQLQGNYKIIKGAYSSSGWTAPGTIWDTNVAVSGDYEPALGTAADGNLIMVWLDHTNTNDLRYKEYDGNGNQVVVNSMFCANFATNSGIGGSGLRIRSVKYAASTDIGSTSYVMCCHDVATNKCYNLVVNSTSQTYTLADSWFPPSKTKQAGVVWNGSSWRSIDSIPDANVQVSTTTYSGFNPKGPHPSTTMIANVGVIENEQVALTWYDGTHETAIGQAATTPVYRRAFLSINDPTPPTGLTGRAYIYDTYDTSFHLLGPMNTGSGATVFNPPSTFSGALPLNSPFPSTGSPGRIYSEANDANSKALIDLEGNGSGRVGRYQWTAAGDAVVGMAGVCPLGSVLPYVGTTAPVGWLLCQGQTVNQTQYPDLYNLIGTKFGIGDGTTGSFSLPNMQGAFPMGASASHALASKGGNETVSLATGQIPAHTHALGNHTHGGSTTGNASHVHNLSFSTSTGSTGQNIPLGQTTVNRTSTQAVDSTSGVHQHTIPADNSQSGDGSGAGGLGNPVTPVELLNPFLAVNYIIKV